MNNEEQILNELLALKVLMKQQSDMIQMFIPTKAPISFIAQQTGKSRHALRNYIMRNYEPERDFWKESGKIFVAQNVAIDLIKRSA